MLHRRVRIVYSSFLIRLVDTEIRIYCCNNDLIQESQRLALRVDLGGKKDTGREVIFVILQDKAPVIKQLVNTHNLIEGIIQDSSGLNLMMSHLKYYSNLDLFVSEYGSTKIYISSYTESLIQRFLVTLYFICTLDSLEHNELILHGCGVTSGENGFLFLGKGGSGKSTIATLSLQAGKEVLSDDIICIDCAGRISLIAAPGMIKTISSGSPIHPKLKVVFSILKSYQDELLPLGKAEISQILFTSFFENSWNSGLTRDLRKEVFHLTSFIARQTEGCELHFRKSPDFWRLIDKNFTAI